ncbi:MAG: RNA polymerase sigma factor [Bacteroidota bacterium]
MTSYEFSNQLLGLQKNLKHFAYTLTTNEDDAKDLLQDTYLKAMLNQEKYVDNTNLKAWTFTIMKNIFINNYRKNQKTVNILETVDDLSYLRNNYKSSSYLPESEYSKNELTKGIKKLNDDQRIPFEMHNNGFKYKEIASTLNLSIGTVKSRIFFTRKKLMENFKDYMN